MNACTVMKLRGNYARMFNEDFFFLGGFQKSQNWIFGEFFYQSLVKDEIKTQEVSCKTRFRFLFKIYLVEREALIFPLSR